MKWCSTREALIGIGLVVTLVLLVGLMRGSGGAGEVVAQQPQQRQESALQDLKLEIGQQKQVIVALDHRVGEALAELRQQRKEAKTLHEEVSNLVISSTLKHKEAMEEIKQLGKRVDGIKDVAASAVAVEGRRGGSGRNYRQEGFRPSSRVAVEAVPVPSTPTPTASPPEGDLGTPAKMFDCFLFNSELDWLEIHVNELIDVVDVFILVEARRTFTDKPRVPLYEKYKEQVFPNREVRDKIKHIVIDDFEPLIAPMNESIYSVYGNSWKRERAQRERLWPALLEAGMQPGDLVNLGDVDEIPRAQNLIDRKKGCSRFNGAPSLSRSHQTSDQAEECKKFPVGLSLNNFMYNYWWVNNNSYFETQVFRYDGTNLKQISRSSIGVARVMNPRAIWVPESERGWHCSWCFSSMQEINRKFNSFSHQELNVPENNNPANIKWSICTGKSLFRKNFPDWKFIAISPQDLNAPAYLKKMLGLPVETSILNKQHLKILEENEDARHRFSYLIPSGSVEQHVIGPGKTVSKWAPSCDLPLKQRNITFSS